MADETFTKTDLDKAVKDAVEEATKGLKQNLSDALDEAKEAKRKLRAAADVKPEDLHAAEDRADKAEKALADAQKLLKEATSAKEKAEGTLKAEQAVTHKLIAENGLVEALTKAGVSDPAYLDAVKALHFGQVKVVAEGDVRKAMYGDKPLDEAIKEWAASDVGKKFVAAPNNSGGGAGGGDKNKTTNVSTMTRAAYNALPQEEQGALGQKMAKGELKIIDEAA